MTSTGFTNAVDVADSKEFEPISKALEGIVTEHIDEKTKSKQLELLDYSLDLDANAKALEKDCVL